MASTFIAKNLQRVSWWLVDTACNEPHGSLASSGWFSTDDAWWDQAFVDDVDDVDAEPAARWSMMPGAVAPMET